MCCHSFLPNSHGLAYDFINVPNRRFNQLRLLAAALLKIGLPNLPAGPRPELKAAFSVEKKADGRWRREHAIEPGSVPSTGYSGL